MFSSYVIRVSIPGIILSLIGVTIFSSLAFWQIKRAQEKQALQDEINLRQLHAARVLKRHEDGLAAAHYEPAEAHGYFDQSHQILVDNEIMDGQAGYHVLTPLILEDGTAILVNRGWIAQGASRADLPAADVPSGHIKVTGTISPPKSRPALVLDEGMVDPGMVWLFLDMDKYARVSGLDLASFVILMDPRDEYGYVRKWPRYDAKIWMHIGYAIHWFAFAVATVVIYLAVNIKKAK